MAESVLYLRMAKAQKDEYVTQATKLGMNNSEYFRHIWANAKILETLAIGQREGEKVA